jgi:uracil-DNA glycosylase family 4
MKSNPDYNCPLCPRLVSFRHKWREAEPEWHNGPVDTWAPTSEDGGDASVSVLIIGLAPGLRGANRTARPFTGDYAGDLLYSTLLDFGLAKGEYRAAPDDGLRLVGTAITNSVRCVPPENKPVGAEINNCRQFLLATLARFENLRALVTLGKIAHDTTTRALGERVAAHPFGHATRQRIAQYDVFSSYHCSRYNTNTGRLTPEMFQSVFRAVAKRLQEN